jgi:hypothetical protein
LIENNFVSILLLMDDALEYDKCYGLPVSNAVSILLLMDDALEFAVRSFSVCWN